MEDLPQLLTVNEAAGLLRVSRRTLTRWIAAGVIASTRIGGRRLILADALGELLTLGEHRPSLDKRGPGV